MGARAVGLWVGERKPLCKTPLRGNPSPESTYPTYLLAITDLIPFNASCLFQNTNWQVSKIANEQRIASASTWRRPSNRPRH